MLRNTPSSRGNSLLSSRHIQTILVLCGLLAAASTLRAQELGLSLGDISMSPTPVGSGARAAGMADAFVAVADDATAASWNPAGLVQLERPEFSVVGAYNGMAEFFWADYHREFDSNQYTEYLGLNYLSAAYPLPVLVLGRSVCLSLSYQNKYDFSHDFTFDLNRGAATSSGRVLNMFENYSFRREGGLGAITPAIAFEITRRISVGAAFNIWQPTFLCANRWEQSLKLQSVSFFDSQVFLNYSKNKVHPRIPGNASRILKKKYSSSRNP